MIFYGDLETYSEVPIKHGIYRYAENCEVLLFTYAIDDGPVKVVDWTLPGHAVIDQIAKLEDLLGTADEVVFHNSMFDRTVLRLQIPQLCPPIGRWRDTMAQALAHSLPDALDKLCSIMRVPAELKKLDTGRQLIQLFCKPRPKSATIRRATRETHPREWKQFVEYAVHDVEAMRYLHKRLPTWNYSGDELALWHLDQRINDRGMYVDRDLARAALDAFEREKRRLAGEAAAASSGEIRSTTERNKLLRYVLTEHGVELPDLTKDTVDRRINDPELPAAVRELLVNRLQASSTAPTKYKALLDAVSSDGRLRGTMQFAGAGRTGRWSGRVFQPQNLMRTPKRVKAAYDDIVALIKAGAIDMLDERPIEAIAGVVRGVISAPPGAKLAIADWSNIEGRVLAWQAGEDWKLQAFRDFDEGRGHDLYALSYARAFRVTPESVMADDKAGGIQRQVGKVMELALGYQGSIGAFLSMAAVYKVDLARMAELAWSALPAEKIGKGIEAWERACAEEAAAAQEHRRPTLTTFGLSKRVYVVCHALTHLWRDTNPAITSYWWALQDAVARAIETPGETFSIGPLVIDRSGNWLRISLPSRKRYLCYPSPKCERDERGRPTLSYMGTNQYTKRWQRIYSYGGKFAENTTQAIARDILGVALPRLEAAAFPLVLHVHDEPVGEVPEEDDRLDVLSKIMRTPPQWAEGLPLAAGAHYANRYQKG